MNKTIAATALFLLVTGSLLAVTQEQLSSAHLDILLQQGVPKESILGVDGNGVPRVCGTGLQTTTSLVSADANSTSNLLPAGMRAWECIPNVIRNDGIDWFRLEVDVNGPVDSVLWSGIWDYYFVSESGTNALWLRDDGLSGDRKAGDYIYTSERCRYRAEIPMAPTQNYSTNTPAGIYINQVGQLTVYDSTGNTFLIPPALAVLNTNIPAVETVMLASNVQVSAHLINIMTTNRETQLSLRLGNNPAAMTKQVYAALPDAYDFLAFFSTDHVEYIPQTTSANFISGRFFTVLVNYTGTGQSPLNNTTAYGSSGRLMGLPFFDIMERGIGDSKNAAHEISHQWSANVTTTLNITTGDGHYHRNCSINSILGGLYKPVTNASGGIIRECNAYDHYVATPLDKYMMGLISTSAVPALYVSSNILTIACGAVITNLRPLVTIAQIVAAHGVRSPGPAGAKKDFRIGFVTGSHNRLLNATEMTFYDLMAAHFTRAFPPSYASPRLTEGWVPITKFFGEGTAWSGDVLGLIRPTITEMEYLTNGSFRVRGTGYPGKTYRLLGTTNFLQWTTLTANSAATNGEFVFQDNSQPRPVRRYYRVATP